MTRRRPSAQTRTANPNRVPVAKPRQPSALTAAGQRIDRRNADSLQRLVQPWQKRAFAYYDVLGEIKYAARFHARALSQIRLYAAELDSNGEVTETQNPAAIAALERIKDPGGTGRSGLQANYGRLMFIAGESYLFTSQDENGVESWEMLSTDELRVQGSTYLRYAAPSLPGEEFHEIPDDAWTPQNTKEGLAFRIWQRHPQFSMLPDSTMEGVLDLCEELVLLTQAVRARARSRLAGAGALFIDERLSPPPNEPVGDEDPEEDVLLMDLTEAMTAPIANEGAASAVVPLLVRVPVPDGMKLSDMMYLFQPIDPMQVYPETGLRYECIKRIAIGLDIPPEILLGLMDANHWTGWLIDEQTWKHHLQPMAEQLCADLTSSYYAPTLKAENVPDWENYLIAYDASKLINHPDKSKDAKDAYDRRAIGKVALRDATGFTEDDAMPEEEVMEQLAVQTNNGDLAKLSVGIEPTPRPEFPPPAGPQVELPPGVVGEPRPGEVVAGPPEQKPTEQEAPVVASMNGHHREQQTARMLGAADLAFLRAREAAGNRVRSLANRDAEASAVIRGIPAGQVPAMLGREVCKRLRAPSELELVTGVRPLVLDALRLWGLDDAALAGKVAEQIERHAARTLYEKNPPSFPAPFTSWLMGLTNEVPV